MDFSGPGNLDVAEGISEASPGGTLVLKGLPDGEYLVRTISGDDQIGWQVVSVQCGLQGVDVGVDCDDGGVISVENPNDETVLVDVDGPDDGDAISGLATLESEESREFDGLADGDYLVRTLTEEEDQIAWSVATVDCEESD